jgi:PhnB protein
MTRLHTYLNFEGNAEEAFTFYKSVFGGEFSSLFRFRDLPKPEGQVRGHVDGELQLPSRRLNEQPL